ncbi:hypothetical protein CPB84DRAFT_1842736 [Gymnopilus junonius]|uniref:Uncharacterized protein n=1 Tax=Gymnopilus junonius TaxID=109634 RepID=A0A9P5P0D4_GYMJU|nr:hypothetical protein CPB84DRAFT_1842736 [Gymnopilus junonius]
MPEVDTRSQGVFVNAAGLLYASIGFSLSVLAALINLLHRPKAQDAPIVSTYTRAVPSLSPRGRRILRSVSDESSKTPLRISKQAPKPLPSARRDEASRPKEPSSEKKVISSRHVHRRSKSMASIPIITIDYFGSTDTLNALRSAGLPKTVPQILEATAELSGPLPRPTINDVASSSTSSTFNQTTAHCGDDQPAPGFRLFGIKPWGKERSKGLERRQSSPQLCRSSSLPRSSCHKQTSSDGMLRSPTKNEKKTKARKPLRKMPSAPAQGKEKIGMKFDVSFRHGEKKRSKTLRTQPYDAPYFALPPVPPVPPLPAAYIKASMNQVPTTLQLRNFTSNLISNRWSGSH